MLKENTNQISVFGNDFNVNAPLHSVNVSSKDFSTMKASLFVLLLYIKCLRLCYIKDKILCLNKTQKLINLL